MTIPLSNVDALLRPRSVAVIGATPRRSATGFRVFSNLLAGGFSGPAYPVNPKYDEVLERECFRSISDLPIPVDLVFAAVRGDGTPAILEESARCGVKAVVINASGFADAGAEGRVLQDRVAALARDTGIALCGPNNNGFMNFLDRTMLCVPSPPPDAKSGGVAIVSQSGSVSFALSRDRARMGLAYVISAGNEAVLSVADYLAAVVRDERVRIVVLFLESIRRPAEFAAAAAGAARLGKPVIAVKVGRSAGAGAAVMAHTGALAGEDAVYDAFFRRHGVVRVDDLDELIEATVMFRSSASPPAAKGVAVVTLSGGQAALIADIADAVGVEFSAFGKPTIDALRALLPTTNQLGNPLDAWGMGWDAAQLRRTIAAVAADPAIGLVVPAIESGTAGDINKVIASICIEVARATGKHFAVLNNTAAGDRESNVQTLLDRAGIPYLSGVRPGLSAIRCWLRHRPLVADPPEVSAQEAQAWRSLAIKSPGLSEPDRFQLLAELGMPMVACRRADSADKAVAIAALIGYPVVVKGTAPDCLHKTELGLVKVGLGDAMAVRHAYAEIADRLKQCSQSPDAAVVVQPQVRGGCELIVGIRNVVGFGTLVLLGLGGTMVELIRDTVVRIGPVTRSEAMEMLDESRAGELMKGFRGRGPLDRDAVAAAVAGLSRFGVAASELVAAAELNPLIVGLSGCGAWAVDAVIEKTMGTAAHK